MHLKRWITAATWLLGCCLKTSGQAAISAIIPPLQGKTLDGQAVRLPQVLKGKINVLVLGFSQDSREQVTAWGKRLATDYSGSDQVTYYMMPILEDVPRILRGWVLKRITESTSLQAKRRLLPIMDHEAEWKHAAGFQQPDVAYVLLVGEDGAVQWRAQGPATDAVYATLTRQLGESSHGKFTQLQPASSGLAR